MLLEDFLIL